MKVRFSLYLIILTKTDRIQVMRNNGKEYLVITEPLHSPNFKGYSVLIHSLEHYNNLVKSLYIIACFWSTCYSDYCMY